MGAKLRGPVLVEAVEADDGSSADVADEQTGSALLGRFGVLFGGLDMLFEYGLRGEP